MPCCVLAAAVIAVIKVKWTQLRAMWLRRSGRIEEAALLLEDDIRVIAAARARADEVRARAQERRTARGRRGFGRPSSVQER
jgi:hypothetical protein